jgi:hypothetical protein
MRATALIGLAMAAATLIGCTNPDAATTTRSRPRSALVQNAGEPPAPRAPASQTQAPVNVQPTASKAAVTFAALYVNWSYRTLVGNQRTLAAMAVGPARLSERQAAASAQHDTTIARGHIYNRGQVVDVAPDALRSGWWAIVTREQTGGNAQYEGLSAAYHVTLAQVVPVLDGYAVAQWLPQS